MRDPDPLRLYLLLRPGHHLIVPCRPQVETGIVRVDLVPLLEAISGQRLVVDVTDLDYGHVIIRPRNERPRRPRCECEGCPFSHW